LNPPHLQSPGSPIPSHADTASFMVAAAAR
jgi:hypothetical protein